MPNIAFLSLIYLLLAVPGFLYRSVYLSGEFTRNLLPRSWTDDIGKAILYSLPFHLLWIGIAKLSQFLGISHHTLNLETVLRLMAAEYTVTYDYSFHGIVSRFSENAWYVLFYYLAVLFTAFWAGLGARRLVWNNEWDLKVPWLRYRSDWLYKIMGRGSIKGVPLKDTGAWIDILSEQETEVPGKAMLYRGLAAGFTTEDNGALRDIILTDVERTGGVKRDAVGELVWTKIPGKFFVLSYSKIRNMNITYEPHSHKLLNEISKLSAGPEPPAVSVQPQEPLKPQHASPIDSADQAP
jgi:hypothetical protein